MTLLFFLVIIPLLFTAAWYLVLRDLEWFNPPLTEHQKIQRYKGYRLGFFLLQIELLLAIFIGEELTRLLPIRDLLLIAMASSSLVTICYWIWHDAYYTSPASQHRWHINTSFLIAGLHFWQAYQDYHFFQNITPSYTSLIVGSHFFILGLFSYLKKWHVKKVSNPT